MTILFQDNANRANNATVDATFWTENGAAQWAINGNQFECTGGGAFFLITTTSAHAAIANCKASGTRQTTVGTWDGGIVVRSTSTGSDCYFINPIDSTNAVSFWRRVASADTQVGTDITGITHTIGDKWTFEISGTGATVTLKVYQNDVLKGTQTDSDAARIVAAGQAGFTHFQPAVGTYDNFIIEDLIANSIAWIRA